MIPSDPVERAAYGARLMAARNAAIDRARIQFPKADDREVRVRAVISMVRELMDTHGTDIAADGRNLEEIEYALGGLLPPVNARFKVA